MDKNTWRTPDSLFGPLNEEFNFGLDASASHGAQKCPVYLSPDENALVTDWRQYAELFGVADRFVWINPPFTPMQPWSDRVLQMHAAGMDIVMLTNAATGTRWFRELAEEAAQIRFTTGRIAFIHPDTGVQMKGNNMAQSIFVFSHTRHYDQRVVWFDV